MTARWAISALAACWAGRNEFTEAHQFVALPVVVVATAAFVALDRHQWETP